MKSSKIEAERNYNGPTPVSKNSIAATPNPTDIATCPEPVPFIRTDPLNGSWCEKLFTHCRQHCDVQKGKIK